MRLIPHSIDIVQNEKMKINSVSKNKLILRYSSTDAGIAKG